MGLFDLFRKKDINAGVDEYRRTEGSVLLDVRTEQEYSDGHIEKSINIPLDIIDRAPARISDKGTPLFVYCRSGARSGQAVAFLKNNGYLNVNNIGGIMGYTGKVVRR